MDLETKTYFSAGEGGGGQSQENITVARPLTGGRSTKDNRSSYDTPKLRPLSIVL